MLIGIDGNEANLKDRVGVNKYAFELIWGLFKLNERQRKHKLIVYLKNEPLKDLPKPSECFEYKIIPGGKFWVLSKLTPYLFLNPEKIDVLFSPSHYLPIFNSIPKVCSIMDLGYLESSGQFEKLTFWQLRYWTAISILASKGVLTISESTRRDIVRHYPFASKKVELTYPGFDKNIYGKNISLKEIEALKNKYSIVESYFLYLGTLKPSKNIEGLVRAFSLIAGKYKDMTLVIAGKKGWLFENIFKVVEDLHLKNRVCFTDFVKEEEKPSLIAGAKAFILPSFWEGFGLDAVSAMAIGVPVILSKVGSLPEVGGEAVIYIDPKRKEDIARAMEKVLKMSKSEYNSLINRGFEQVKKFDWGKTAKKTMGILEQVAGSK